MSKKPTPPQYPPEHLQAYLTLGIRLGAPDFEEKMQALRYLIDFHKQKSIWKI